jgi:hypothetical protein
VVPPSSDRISRVPPYLIRPVSLRVRGCHPYCPAFHPVPLTITARLVPVRSPLLGEYLLISFPTGTEMFQFPAFALLTLCIQIKSTCFNQRSFAVHSTPEPAMGRSRSVRFRSRGNNKTTNNRRLSGGFPHSDIPGSKGALASPGLIAECHVLHRLLLPRHPPNALLALDPIRKKTGPHSRAPFVIPQSGKWLAPWSSGQKS